MKPIVRRILPILILGVASLGAIALFQLRPEPEIRRPEVVPPLVRVVPVIKQDVELTVASQGTVGPRIESQLVPEVSGRVLRMSPSLVVGGFFDKGEVLLEIDPFDYRQAVAEQRARVAQARLRLAQEEAEAEVARREWEELGGGDEAKPLTLREPQLADARAAVEAAEAVLERARRDLERTTVRAPFDGRVRNEQVDVGQYVNRGVAIAIIYAVDAAEIRLPLPDGDLAFVDLPDIVYRDGAGADDGPEVILRADFAGEVHEWRGRVVRTEGEIDPRSRMVNVVAGVADPYARGDEDGRPPLVVGMFVHAEIRGKTVRDVAVLPRAALRAGDRVWVVTDDRLRFREVELLRAERDVVLIGGGLDNDELVCISPMEAVTDGMRVRVGEIPETDDIARGSEGATP
jgi:RND family efflux transporter MFP subunit